MLIADGRKKLDDERYFEVFEHLIAITKSHPKLIRAVGLCNFDATTTERICLHLLKVKGEVGIVSNQVQYSLVDQRPRFAMTEVCKKYGIKLLTYGTFVSISNKGRADGSAVDSWRIAG